MPRFDRPSTPASRRHLTRLLDVGWRLSIYDASVSLTLTTDDDETFEARGATVAQAVAIARGTTSGITFWDGGRESGAVFTPARFPNRGNRTRAQRRAAQRWLRLLARDVAQERVDRSAGRGHLWEA